MKATVIGFTHSHIDQGEDFSLDNLARFAGAQGGICYMKDRYFGTYVSDPEKALKRFGTIIPTGHHSVADHSTVTMLLEGIPKIVAMYLNNLTVYATSEKSGRYTEMVGNTVEEVELYNKWHKIFTEQIVKIYGDKIDEKTVDKLAKENARYFLSVFTPVTMSYTTNIRQWNYIMDWLDRFDYSQFREGYFKEELKKHFSELRAELEALRIDILRDHKGRNGLNLVNNERIMSATEQFGETYAILYETTFVGLAQAHRHRTLKYNIYFDGESKGFFVPPIIEGTELEKEWLHDMSKVAHLIPQGTEVMVLERGDTEDFFLKVKERICGRAQIEIARQTDSTVRRFAEHKSEMPNYLQNIIEDYVRKDGTPKAKCELLKCREVCVWGSRDAVNRKI